MPQIGEEKQTSFAQEPVLVDGTYPATLKEVKEYTRTNKSGEEYTNLAWIFDVEATEDDLDDDVEYDDNEFPFSGHFEVVAHTGENRSSYATSRWAQINLDQIVPADCTSTDDVVGAACMASVTSYVGADGRTNNKVARLSKARKGQKQGRTVNKTAGQKASEAEESKDFDSIPF